MNQGQPVGAGQSGPTNKAGNKKMIVVFVLAVIMITTLVGLAFFSRASDNVRQANPVATGEVDQAGQEFANTVLSQMQNSEADALAESLYGEGSASGEAAMSFFIENYSVQACEITQQSTRTFVTDTTIKCPDNTGQRTIVFQVQSSVDSGEYQATKVSSSYEEI